MMQRNYIPYRAALIVVLAELLLGKLLAGELPAVLHLQEQP
jgi:hypothetical protein